MKILKSKNKGLILLLLSSLFLSSCYFNHGNRQPDINYRLDISISPYYVSEYMKTLDSSYGKSSDGSAIEELMTSEMANYPETFIPVTDSVLGYKYVIEFHNFDSIRSIENHYIALASIYDFNKKKWVKDQDELENNELEKFRKFFKDSVLTKVVNRYQNQIPDSLLWVSQPGQIEIKALD